MTKRQERAKNARRQLMTWFKVSQVIGLVGALVFGLWLNQGFSGFLVGYLITALLCFGAVVGVA